MSINQTRQHLQDRLDELRTQHAAVSALVGADTNGDAADLADQVGVRDEAQRIDAVIRAYERVLSQLAAAGNTVGGAVTVGTVVRLQFDGTPEPETFLIAPALADTDALPALSPDSPLGRALLGATPGQRVSYYSPRGSQHVTLAG